MDWKRFLGTAKPQEFDAYRFRQWRWFWDFGGGIFTDLMVHWIDVVHWYLDLDHPASAASIGDWFSAKDVWETPDTVQTLLRYPDKDVQVYFEGTFSSNRHGAMVEFMGTEGTLYIDRGRYEVIPDRDKKKPQASSAHPRHRPAQGSRFLRQAGRRVAPPDELGRVHPRPVPEELQPRGSGRQRRQRRPPRKPVGAERAGGDMEGIANSFPGSAWERKSSRLCLVVCSHETEPGDVACQTEPENEVFTKSNLPMALISVMLCANLSEELNSSGII